MRYLTFFLLLFSLLLCETVPAVDDTAAESERIIFTKNISFPEKIYIGEVFAVTIDAIIAEDIFDTIDTSFGDYYGVDILTKRPTWFLKEQNTFSLTYYIKVSEKYIKLPDLSIRVTREGKTLDTIVQAGEKIRTLPIQPNNKFCQVVAENLTITNQKIDKYDDQLNIIVLEMESLLGNLEEFSLPFVREEGIDWSSVELPKTRVFYYGIIPNTMESVEFNYFRPSTGEFKKVTVAFDFSKFGQKTSTQIEINPNKKGFPYLKVMLTSLLVLLFLLLYIWKKHPLFLILSVVIAALLIYMTRDKSVTVKPDAKVYLLPTKNASIFFTTTHAITTEMIKKREGYFKIMLPDDKIGWIKEDDVYKD